MNRQSDHPTAGLFFIGYLAQFPAGIACLALGVSRRTLIRWTKTRGLTPRGKDTRGRNLYNLADLWAAQAARTPPRAPE